MFTMNKVTFGAGCFWGVQASFDKIEGVTDSKVGYMGGDVENPSYEQVCSNKTGHVEVVQLTYDPKIISYEELLDNFFKIHNPTQKNRQGPDIGSQYRSVIFYHTEDQRKIAEIFKRKIQNSLKFKKDVVTDIEPAKKFWLAEEYHQKYFDKNSSSACNIHL